MDKIFIVSATEKLNSTLSDFLSADSMCKITTATSGSEARRTLLQKDFDIVIINTPLSDEFGHDLSLVITEQTSCGVILLVKSDISDAVAEKVEDYGIFVVSKPINRALFFQALKLVKASRKRITGLKSENQKLQKQIQDIKIVDRAKCLLIEHLKMTESDAHSFIEKQAMDKRMTKRQISQGILGTYENL